MADDDEVEVRGIKRPLVENYSDDDEEEEARRKEGNAFIYFGIIIVLIVVGAWLLNIWFWPSCVPTYWQPVQRFTLDYFYWFFFSSRRWRWISGFIRNVFFSFLLRIWLVASTWKLGITNMIVFFLSQSTVLIRVDIVHILTP